MRRLHTTSPASHTSIEAFKHSRNLEAIGLFLFTFFQAMVLDFAKDSHNITNVLREQPTKLRAAELLDCREA
jgi:hypothetical protein